MNSDAFKYRLEEIIGDQSVNSFAKKCGVLEGNIRRYLKEGKLPGTKILKALADGGEVNAEWLGYGQGPKKKEIPKEEPAIIFKEEQCRYEIEKSIKVPDLVKKTIEVLESETIYRHSLAWNINSFHQAIQTEKSNEELKLRLTQVEEENNNLEKRMALLEERLSRGDHCGDQHESMDQPAPATGTKGM